MNSQVIGLFPVACFRFPLSKSRLRDNRVTTGQNHAVFTFKTGVSFGFADSSAPISSAAFSSFSGIA